MPAFSTVERAFQIARAGDCSSIDDLRQRLTREGYMDATAQTSFPSIRKQLLSAMQGDATPRPRLRARKPGVLRLPLGEPAAQARS